MFLVVESAKSFWLFQFGQIEDAGRLGRFRKRDASWP